MQIPDPPRRDLRFYRVKEPTSPVAEVEVFETYDLGVIHCFPGERPTFDEIVGDVVSYNAEFPGEGFNADPAFIALSLVRAIEAGFLEVNIEDF